MRLLLGGILCLFTASLALAQATGDVESIGFGHAFRPGCWTPMVVRLTPTGTTPFEGKIAVYQEDLDHDHAIFTRPISLRGNAGGGSDKTQRFWMYFIPQPDLLRDGGEPNNINRHLSVYLTTTSGKQVTRLLVQDPLDALDNNDGPRSRKLVLCVSDQSAPVLGPYGQSVLGDKEDIAPAMIPIRDVRNLLPENVLGYEGVDCVIWFDADPAQLSGSQRTALEQYIRMGGQFVISQTTKPTAWQMVTRGLANLLPVDVDSIGSIQDLSVLKKISAQRFWNSAGGDSSPIWKDVGPGPFDIAIARPKPGAVISDFEQSDTKVYPYIVRSGFGMGVVTWIAQDLGDMTIAGHGPAGAGLASKEEFKWMYIWDHVLQWNNDSQPAPLAPPSLQSLFATQFPGTYQLTQSFLAGMEFPGRSAGFLGVAVLFFIIYWVVAGPGGYAVLAAKKRSRHSWWIFACTAIAATLLTILVKTLALRGAPQIHHVSFVRQTPGEPTWAYSQLGLYIPRNGDETVDLQKTVTDQVSYVTAYPSLNVSDEGAPPQSYEVPVFDLHSVTFPFRSTLKKLQTQWIGDLPLGITGAAHLADPGRAQGVWIDGTLLNASPKDLRDVYLVFRSRSGDQDIDRLIYLPHWKTQTSIDLAELSRSSLQMSDNNRIGDDKSVHTALGVDPASAALYPWEKWVYDQLAGDKDSNDERHVPLNFSMLSLFERFPAPMRDAYGDKVNRERFEFHRPALRRLDVSASLGAGRLIILAEAEDTKGPLPSPISVDGDSVAGVGVTYYQFLLPLDRSALNVAATQPSTTQATQKP